MSQCSKKLNGFVLLIVLVLLQIMTMIGLYGLMNATWFIKKNRSHFQRLQLYAAATQVLSHIEENITGLNSHCFYPEGILIDITHVDSTWRLQHACSDNLNGIRYDYAVETLGADPCAIVGMERNNQMHMASYYRITLWASFPMLPADFILQSSVVMPILRQGTCTSYMRQVSAGRQMLREWY